MITAANETASMVDKTPPKNPPITYTEGQE